MAQPGIEPRPLHYQAYMLPLTQGSLNYSCYIYILTILVFYFVENDWLQSHELNPIPLDYQAYMLPLTHGSPSVTVAKYLY